MERADVWAPLAAAGDVADMRAPLSGSWWLKGVARLAPGTGIGGARIRLDGSRFDCARLSRLPRWQHPSFL